MRNAVLFAGFAMHASFGTICAGKGFTSTHTDPNITLKQAANYTIEEFEANLSGISLDHIPP